MFASRKALIIVAALVPVILGLPWGGAVPAASAQTISVTSANPPSGDQGTLGLSVAIGGKGFKNGAKAQFFKTGTTEPSGVNVKSTKYVSATQIVATIDIADTAALAQFDIQVQNTDGRTGKGTELFSVTQKIDLCTAPDSVPSPGWYTSGVEVPGALDSTFGNGTGKVVGPRYLDVGYREGRAIAIQTISGEARIVAVGIRHDDCVVHGSYDWGIARYLPDGRLDSTFGSGGMVTLVFAGGTSGPWAVAVQPVDGKIVVVGSGNPSTSKKSSAQYVVVRLNPDGSLDGTFGTGGMAWLTSGAPTASVALQSDGKIVIAGSTGSTGVVTRLTTNGALDPTFNGGGKYIASSSVWFNAVTTQMVGLEERIVVAGSVLDSLSHPIGAVWRFDSSGHLDTSFGASGVATTSFHDIEDGLYHEDLFMDVAVDSSDLIVAAGYAWVSNAAPPYNTHSRLALARYGLDGRLDATFGPGGRVWASSTEVENVGLGLVIQPADQKIVVAGYSESFDAAGNSVDSPAGVWRFNLDGTIDTRFGTGGWVLDPIVSGSSSAGWFGIALQPDGMIVCGGTVIMRGGTSMIGYAAIARFWQ
jgi:uncharacterized delta-60 repeat protein